jgi:predicted XRE-type DNA-binding protein
MSIPLDRLYHYIEQISKEVFNDNVLIYRFWPHGSKNLADCKPLIPYDFLDFMLSRLIICADQEPLDYDYYNSQSLSPDECKKALVFYNLLTELGLEHLMMEFNNLKVDFYSIYKNLILLHSEKRSQEVIKYSNDTYIPVYYWSHAVIALDWFRYAEHVKQQKQVQKTFLIYNRAWSGTREYRLKFAEHLIRVGLENHCQISVSTIEPELGIHYNSHQFKNSVWRPQTVLENFFPSNTAPSHYSADFNIEDYEATDIEVVLETLFDDDRLHLTEKSLRPIACAQPFIIAGTHGSLEYLRSYGFKTFASVWDETYDTIKEPQERLYTIASLMKDISCWPANIRENKIAEAQVIAEYNRRHFFSKEFFNQIIAELQDNLTVVFKLQTSPDSIKILINEWEQLLTDPKIINFLKTNDDIWFPTSLQVNQLLKELKKLF